MKKCRDCEYLRGKRSSVGIECMQPNNQVKWAKREEEEKKNIVARFKQPSAKACRRFKRKINVEYTETGIAYVGENYRT